MEDHLTYDDAISVLESALTFGIDPSLEPIHAMCEAMGNPQERYRCIQVAGTNGKTSTTRMIAALLRVQGLHVGLYTSPHLVRYPERIEVDGVVIDDALFAQAIEAAMDAATRAGVEATEFELLTAAALWTFAHEGVDWAVLECGLGGRWDATSVVEPEVAVITGIALEHTAILGDTIEQIAAEKAAIIKPGSVAVLAEGLAAREVFELRAHEVRAHVVDATGADGAGSVKRRLRERAEKTAKRAVGERPSERSAPGTISVFPAYQAQNLVTAITAATAALGHEPSDDTVAAALEGLVIPGRFEVLRDDPLVIIDAAHNPQSAQTLAGEIASCFVVATDAEDKAREKRLRGLPEAPTLLLGVLDDKDARAIVRSLVPLFRRVVVSASSSPRSIAARELACIVEHETGVAPLVASNIGEAREMLRDEPVIATGSITVAGEVKAIW